MAKVEIEVNQRRYAVGCGEGQEEHIRKLARHIDQQVKHLSETVGAVGEQKLFLMAGLLLADELFEARRKLGRVEAELVRREGEPRRGQQAAQAETAGLFDAAASRLERIAERLSVGDIVGQHTSHSADKPLSLTE